MKSLFLAAVAVAAITGSAPLFAQETAPGQVRLAQAGPMGPHMMQGGEHHRGPGPMGMDRHHGRHGHSMANVSPREFCAERVAREAGRMGYLESRLNLTAEQRPLWERFQAATREGRERERQLCAGAPEQFGAGNVLERDARMQQFLSARLAKLQAQRPALEALYQALTPEQRAIMDRPRLRGRS